MRTIFALLLGILVLAGSQTVDECQNQCDPTTQVCRNSTCVTVDPCEGVTCGNFETCVDGECKCGDRACADGSTCLSQQGQLQCFDSCDNSCTADETCVEGQCIDSCENSCGALETCRQGICYCGGPNGNTECPEGSTCDYDTSSAEQVPICFDSCANACGAAETCRNGVCYCGGPNGNEVCPDGSTCDYDTSSAEQAPICFDGCNNECGIGESCIQNQCFDSCDNSCDYMTEDCVQGTCEAKPVPCTATCSEIETCDGDVCKCGNDICTGEEECTTDATGGVPTTTISCTAPEPDPCDGVTCNVNAGETCVDGECKCGDRICPDGSSCGYNANQQPQCFDDVDSCNNECDSTREKCEEGVCVDLNPCTATCSSSLERCDGAVCYCGESECIGNERCSQTVGSTRVSCQAPDPCQNVACSVGHECEDGVCLCGGIEACTSEEECSRTDTGAWKCQAPDPCSGVKCEWPLSCTNGDCKCGGDTCTAEQECVRSNAAGTTSGQGYCETPDPCADFGPCNSPTVRSTDGSCECWCGASECAEDERCVQDSAGVASCQATTTIEDCAATDDGWVRTKPDTVVDRVCASADETGYRRRLCNKNGVWEDPEDFCESKPPAYCPRDGDWLMTYPGEARTIKCPDNKDGALFRECEVSGKWGDVVNDCSESPRACGFETESCADKYGELSYCKPEVAGSTSANDECVCKDAYQFNADRSGCEPKPVSDCAANDGFPAAKPGALSRQQCPTGQEGSWTRLCSEDGVWDPAIDNCEPIRPVSCLADAGWPDTAPDSVAEKACDDGSITAGQALRRRCSVDGIWADVIDSCDVQVEVTEVVAVLVTIRLRLSDASQRDSFVAVFAKLLIDVFGISSDRFVVFPPVRDSVVEGVYRVDIAFLPKKATRRRLLQLTDNMSAAELASLFMQEVDKLASNPAESKLEGQSIVAGDGASSQAATTDVQYCQDGSAQPASGGCPTAATSPDDGFPLSTMAMVGIGVGAFVLLAVAGFMVYRSKRGHSSSRNFRHTGTEMTTV